MDKTKQEDWIMNVLDVVINTIKVKTGCNVSVSTELESVGLADNVDIVEVLLDLEETFSLKDTVDTEYQDLVTVGDVVKLIESKIKPEVNEDDETSTPEETEEVVPEPDPASEDISEEEAGEEVEPKPEETETPPEETEEIAPEKDGSEAAPEEVAKEETPKEEPVTEEEEAAEVVETTEKIEEKEEK